MRYLVIMLMVIPLAAAMAAEGDTITVDLSKVELPAGVVKAETDLDNRLAILAEQYRAAVEKARADAVKAMEREKSRARDLMVAAAIQSRIDKIGQDDAAPQGGLDLLGAGSDISGAYSSPRWDYTINRITDGYELIASNGGKSTGYVKIGDDHVFTWSGNGDVMVLTESMELICHSAAADVFNGKELPTGNISWTRKLTKKKE